MVQRDAVRLHACWGGMTAFEAKWFQNLQPDPSATGRLNNSDGVDFSGSPLRFRYEKDPFWDTSECCRIHATQI